MAIVAEGERGRVYLSPTPEMEAVALSAKPSDAPETDLPARALGFRVQEYGMTKWRDLFTPRQLVVISALVQAGADINARLESGHTALMLAARIMANEGHSQKDSQRSWVSATVW